MAKATKKKKRVSGKRKGNGFERKIKQQILETFAEFGITPQDAFRSILSGGHKESFGDISLSPALAKLFPYALECKHYNRVDLYQLLKPWKKMGKANKFKEWWKQACEGAVKSKELYPLLVFRSNGQEIMCMLYSHHFYPVVGLNKNVLNARHVPNIRAYHPDGDLYCFRFSFLLKLLKYRAQSGVPNERAKRFVSSL